MPLVLSMRPERDGRFCYLFPVVGEPRLQPLHGAALLFLVAWYGYKTYWGSEELSAIACRRIFYGSLEEEKDIMRLKNLEFCLLGFGCLLMFTYIQLNVDMSTAVVYSPLIRCFLAAASLIYIFLTVVVSLLVPWLLTWAHPEENKYGICRTSGMLAVLVPFFYLLFILNIVFVMNISWYESMSAKVEKLIEDLDNQFKEPDETTKTTGDFFRLKLKDHMECLAEVRESLRNLAPLHFIAQWLFLSLTIVQAALGKINQNKDYFMGAAMQYALVGMGLLTVLACLLPLAMVTSKFQSLGSTVSVRKVVGKFALWGEFSAQA